ncbi:MAG: hypothetical protein JWO87_2611 [Phycisphaerales bacterium]|nr:hypothetical protein [Phycisphaerales bacterium]
MFCRAMWILTLVVFTSGVCPAQVALPVGSNPPALEFPHFPDRLHAFVWRNWNVVATERLAKVLETSPENVRNLADTMGLPPEQAVPAIYKSRLYLTVIRRNWHLLPYDQLLQLLDMSPEQLAITLREDDFLWIKLGSLKPRCAKLVYAHPDENARRREAEIRNIVREVFTNPPAKDSEERFAFLNELGKAIPNVPPAAPRPAGEGPRIVYSYFAVYGDPLSDPSLDPYPDALLQKLAERGVNGVWLHVVLRQLAPSKDFPEFGDGCERRLENLRNLVRRARRFGVGVYLYMNEPRAMPAEFFKNRPEIAGVREGGYVAMCTSNLIVRRWLGDSLAHVFTNVPDLAGVFTITGSENLTNCASHQNLAGCARCKTRTGPDVIAEVNAAIEAGVHHGNPDAKVLVWDWGWPDDWAPAVIAKLPKNVWLMSVSEWSLPLHRGGVAASVGEYSISAVGPGPRATAHWKLARNAGLKCIAKVQLNNTWELSAVPYLPVVDLVAEHCRNLAGGASARTDGMLLSWTLGGYPSPNLEVAEYFASHPASTKDEALDAIARKHFGPAGAPHARKAWTLFSDAFREYPFDGGVIYNCPVQLGPANLLYEKPTGYAATMVGFPYDDVNGWRGPYPAEVLAAQFDKVADGWDKASELLAVAAASAPHEEGAKQQNDEVTNGVEGRAGSLHFRSVANQIRFTLARNAVAGGKLPPVDRRMRIGEMREVLAKEEKLAVSLFALTTRDSRIGFEASNQYYYLPQDLAEKVIDCRWIAGRLED